MTYFPSRKYDDCGQYGDDYFAQLAEALTSVSRAKLHEAATLLADAISDGKTLYSCGNGGSAAIANHLACDCVKGVRTDTALRSTVHSLSSTVELITAIANDISYDEIFAFQLESFARPGDVLIAISSSGNSPNIVKALAWARSHQMRSIAMTGFTGGEAAALAEIVLHVDAHNYGVVEDIHQSMMHVLAQYLRQFHMVDPLLIAERKF